jgi:membrane associated rhomboid family serine protease
MFHCPTCGKNLVATARDGATVFACEDCDGAAVTLESIRRFARPERFIALREGIREGGPDSKRACPSCARSMHRIDLREGPAVLELDACTPCRLVWFDRGETRAVVAPNGPPPPAEMPLEGKRLLAMAMIERERRESRTMDLEAGTPESTWQGSAAFLGLPFLENAPMVRILPLVTWALCAAIVAASLVAFTDLRFAVKAFGMVPSDPLRGAGLTFVSSFLIHGGIMHLLGNVYFLLLFGRNVEEDLGIKRFGMLVAAAAIVGTLAHIALDPRRDLPLVGASTGVSGVLTYFVLQYPRSRIGFLLGRFRMMYVMVKGRLPWFRVPAPLWFAFWLLIQIVGAVGQSRGCTNVSAFGHLGGVAVGVAAWLAWRKKAT